MPLLLQINVTANSGSTGKIAEDIGSLAIEKGWDSWIAYGRGTPKSLSNLIRIGNNWDMRIHGIETRLFDNHGLASRHTTKDFIKVIDKLNPDLIHLHNIHGYFLNYPLLFDFIKHWGGPVIWTLHDCWTYTGHCSHYSYVGCNKWQNCCNNCIQKNRYPASLWLDRSMRNLDCKKDAFLGCKNLHIVTVSDWLQQEVRKSFLKDYYITTIYNGIDTSVFQPKQSATKNSKKIILGVANVWDSRKGLDDFIELRKKLPDNFSIVLVGLSQSQIKGLPKGIIGMQRTESIGQLVELYSMADVYVNTSVEETLGMTTIEAMSCGTPAIVYNSTACPEVIENKFCSVVKQEDIDSLANAVIKTISQSNDSIVEVLRQWVDTNFNKDKNYKKYIDLYESMI
ncbi:glycosyltransferase [Duncaniella freteri]|mgnify:CR=1 FL=1|uniref:glycosyltransferase n=1 Tax=Duncaniella freteri TaxID=2530391 RepID=UPI002573D408|nr:glycosyltransferase [Duncaniella freteri]